MGTASSGIGATKRINGMLPASIMPRATRLPMLLVSIATVVALVALARGPAYHADDAYIVARYAEHLVVHGQLTWNLGEAPVEGFTGYTLLIVMAIATLLHLPPVTTAAALGVGAWFI